MTKVEFETILVTMEDNRTEHQKIETFADITGYSYDISKQLLEAANFNMGVCKSTIFYVFPFIKILAVFFFLISC